MSNGSPDYTRKVKLYAMYNGNLIPVTVDSEGRIIMTPYGVTTVDGELDVNQTEKDREMQGSDGVTLRTIAVDNEGRIIMVPYGTAEVTGAVDVTQTDAVREIQGSDGVTLRTIAVDSAGRIIGVFKGDYLGSLKTIKVDEEGRMIALVTDELDIYGNKIIVGNAELAVRLGSEKFFDRRGDVFLIDNFESGIGKWAVGGDGTGNEQVITAERARSGGYCVKLTGGSDGNQFARMYTFFPYPVLSKWGFETHFSIGPGIDKIRFMIRQETGTHTKLAYILYDRVNQRLQYLDSDNNYQNIETSFLLYENTYLFHVIKLVCDLETHKYHRLIVNQTEYDLSAYDMYSFANVVTNHLELTIRLYSRSGYNDYIYIDNIIVTQNEPD